MYTCLLHATRLAVTWREILPSISVVLCPQIFSFRFGVIGGISAASTLVRSVRRTTMRKVASYEEQVHGLKFNRYLLMTAFPGFADSTAVRKLGLHFMRARNNFGAAVFERGSVSGWLRRQAPNLADMV
jgi:hypothetical protein